MSPDPGPDGVSLRRMRWWDVPAVHALEQRLFDPDTWSVETFWAELAGENRWYTAAVDASGELVGYAGLAVNGPDGDVQTVAVAPSGQGRGVGRRLLGALLARAVELDLSGVLLEVRSDNGPARRLYESAGFERIAVRRRYYQPGDVDAHVMRLRPVRVVGAGA